MKDEKFDLDDISIIPTIESDINSRNECNVFYLDGFLPLMASPMDTVVSKQNVNTYIINDIIPCLPRGEYLDIQNKCSSDYNYVFQSFGLNEIIDQLQIIDLGKPLEYINIKNPFYNYNNILIDIANGHMKILLNVVKRIKKDYPNVKLMVGNIANPLTFKNLAMAGVDYVRCGIGIGNVCVTSSNIGVHYPIGSLINECYKIKKEGGFNTKIVADGGVKNFDDILKLLILGCDYIMIGSLFNKAIESSGFNYLYGKKISNKVANILWKWGLPVKKKYRGMSTKSVQRKWGKNKLITSEGITKYQNIEYNLSQWIENFKDYLKSCMSYCGIRNLTDFIGYNDWVFITNNALKRFKK
jgi:IMP dehydrogenase/GMP reductase